MAELKPPSQFMELSSNNDDPNIGDPPFRMLFSDVGMPTEEGIVKQVSVDPLAMCNHLDSRISAAMSRIDATILHIEKMKMDIERFKQPWYRRLYNWVLTWMD